MNAPILSVRNLGKRFGAVIAARDITVSVPALQTVGVIGSNGAGKTTFINLITGHLRPTDGTIHFEERDITGLPSRTITGIGISRSFQVAQIFPSLTVFENMCAAVGIGRAPKTFMSHVRTPLRSRDTITAAETLLDLFEITNYRHALAAALPQGVRKLLDIGMAIAGSPRLLLLDEPTSGVSIEEKFKLMELIMSALRNRKITVVFVEHDMDIIERFAERVLAFYDGTVIADGTPTATLADARVQTLISGGPRVKGAGVHV